MTDPITPANAEIDKWDERVTSLQARFDKLEATIAKALETETSQTAEQLTALQTELAAVKASLAEAETKLSAAEAKALETPQQSPKSEEGNPIPATPKETLSDQTGQLQSPQTPEVKERRAHKWL